MIMCLMKGIYWNACTIPSCLLSRGEILPVVLILLFPFKAMVWITKELYRGFLFSRFFVTYEGFTVAILTRPKHKADGNLPSASELQRRGLKFEPFTWGIEQIRFDRASSTLLVPCIEMDYQTDVFLRNLVALEAFMRCKTRVLTCYVDLTDRLVDTPHDVPVPKKYGVMYSNLGNDKEVSTLWNGISRSIWRSAYEPIDQTIKDVNSYYRSIGLCWVSSSMHISQSPGELHQWWERVFCYF